VILTRRSGKDNEANKMTQGRLRLKLLASAELQKLMKSLSKSHPDPIMPEAKMSIQPKDTVIKTVPLSPNEPSKVAHLGNSLDPKLELALVKLLQENRDISTWKHADMSGATKELIEHKLHINPNAKLV
jgi:hypothetical protein